VNVHAPRKDGAGELLPCDPEWTAEKAAAALRYLGRDYPERLENLRVLEQHEKAAHEAAMRGDWDAYLESLRRYIRAGPRKKPCGFVRVRREFS
jgi:hypothetical protein